MSEDHNRETLQTFGQLISEVARWTALREVRRTYADVRKTDIDLEALREADRKVAAAIEALDAAIGVTPEEWLQVGEALRELSEKAVRGGMSPWTRDNSNS